VDYYNIICSNALQRIIFMMLEIAWTGLEELNS